MIPSNKYSSDLRLLSEEDWEDLCDGCGKCCEAGGCGASGFGCPLLDTTTNRCMDYPGRLNHHYAMASKVTPENTLSLHRQGRLPDSCAYVRFAKGQAPLTRPVERAKLTPWLLAPEKLTSKYNKARAEWDDMKKGSLGHNTFRLNVEE